MAEYINKNESVDESYLQNWYIDSVDEAVTPHWTEEHIEELVKDFIVIPIETPAADVEPVKRGHWICIGDIDEYIFECSECHEIYYLNEGTPKEHQYNYCPNCGAKLCKGEENNA